MIQCTFCHRHIRRMERRCPFCGDRSSTTSSLLTAMCVGMMLGPLSAGCNGDVNDAGDSYVSAEAYAGPNVSLSDDSATFTSGPTTTGTTGTDTATGTTATTSATTTGTTAAPTSTGTGTETETETESTGTTGDTMGTTAATDTMGSTGATGSTGSTGSTG